MSRKGNGRKNKRSAVSRAIRREGEARHNAPTGSGFNRFRNEQVHGVPYASHADMKAASFEYIEVFSNRKRLPRPSATARPCSSWRIGSAGSVRKKW